MDARNSTKSIFSAFTMAQVFPTRWKGAVKVRAKRALMAPFHLVHCAPPLLHLFALKQGSRSSSVVLFLNVEARDPLQTDQENDTLTLDVASFDCKS